MKVVDMHCDTISELLHIRKQWEHDTMLENHLQIDLNLSLIHISEPTRP